jgi:hypothetical protein
MAYVYRPRGMPARYLEGAPDSVRRHVLDIIKIVPAAPLDFDIVIRPFPGAAGIDGLDFGADGSRGCHFYLQPHEMRAYRDRNRRKRVAWSDLPERTQRAILAYLEWTPGEV